MNARGICSIHTLGYEDRHLAWKREKKYQDLYQAFRKLKSRYLTAPRRTVILKTFQDIYGTIDYDLRQTDTK